MRKSVSLLSIILAASLGAGSGGAQSPSGQALSSQADVEKAFDAAINPDEMSGWMKTMAAEPNHVGSAHDKANADLILKQFKDWGWDAKIETFKVLYPTPVKETLELVAPKRFKATLTERPIPGDATSSRTKNELPAYVAYQGDGDVTAPLVYVNYGMPDDYKALQRMGVDVKGKIVIARYGQGWRGLKPKLAQDHGAVGCIIYSDPRDDGYSTDDAYPEGRVASGARIPARLGRRHDALSRRSPDARRRRHRRRQAPHARRSADDPEDSRPADFLRRCRAFPWRAGGPRRAGEFPRLAGASPTMSAAPTRRRSICR